MLSTCTYTPDAVSINGQTFPARYTVSPDGTVFADVTVQEGENPVSLRIRISPDHPDHAAALDAAQPAPVEEQPAPVEEQPAPVEEQTDPIEEQPAAAQDQERSPKAAGFHWSPTMQSWNKRLTFRAYRAAQALAVQLNALYA
ncbi:MAG: hypothetical protein ACI4PG_02235 [Candidatus Ventricola sp.]